VLSVRDAGYYFCALLKYLKSGGGWSFLAGIKKPSALVQGRVKA
jgi:hypothetical protein